MLTALLLAAAVAAADREPPLVAAARAQDLAALRALLRDTVNVDQGAADGTTALHWAAHHNDIQAIDLLLGARAVPDARNRYGVFPLHLASVNGSAPVIERLLKAGADPNGALPEGETALMTATRSGSVAAVKTLLAHGADVNAREAWKGQTALMWAAVENHADTARLLIESGAEIDARSTGGVFTPLLFAVRGGHIAVARTLLDAGADVNTSLADGSSVLTLAVMNAHYELAAMLLDRGADPRSDAQGWTALHQIAWTRRPNYGYNLPGAVPTGSVDALELVRKLVMHGADVNARQTKEPRDGNRNMLNRIGATPFLLAAKAVDLPLMRTLLDVGADPKLPNADGTTPLMVAAGVGIWAPGESPGTDEEAVAAVQFLLDAGGGNVTDIDANGNTALHGAVLRAGSIPLVTLLVSRGARLDVKNAKGWTPLTIADGVEYTPDIFKRYPETAAILRVMMREHGLPVPPPPGP